MHNDSDKNLNKHARAALSYGLINAAINNINAVHCRYGELLPDADWVRLIDISVELTAISDLYWELLQRDKPYAGVETDKGSAPPAEAITEAKAMGLKDSFVQDHSGVWWYVDPTLSQGQQLQVYWDAVQGVWLF